MGYQESYVFSKNINELEDLIKRKGYDFFNEEKWATPVAVITLKKRILHFGTGEWFPKGSKFVYVVGDRGNQRNPDDLFDGEQPEDTRVIFTENFPSEEIFKEHSSLAICEEFAWEDVDEDDLDFGVTKTEEFFNDIYDALVVNNHKNHEFVVNCDLLEEEDLEELLEKLEEEDIEYEVSGSKLVCRLDTKRLEIAQKVYTEEARKKLREEEEALEAAFMKGFI